MELKHPAVVFTVILINREDSRKENLTGSEIRVGFDALPKNNPFCAYADTSGAYQCLQGLQGTYVGIYNPNMNKSKLQLCEIRAYPWISNQYLQEISASNSIADFPAQNALDFSTHMLTDSLAKNKDAILVRYVYNLTSTVYVSAVILLGDPDNNFENTKDWYITAGNSFAETNPSFDGYSDKSDRFGREIKIETFSNKVAFIKNINGKEFNMVYAAVFATSVDCSTINLNWS